MSDYKGLESLLAVVLSTYLTLGLVGNLLTVIALIRSPRVRNATAYFIISLCVADFLFCILVLPWEVCRFVAGKWIWGQGPICTVVPLLRYWNVAVSLLSIAMITINRYIMIAHYNIYKIVYKKTYISLMIVFCWTFPICMLFPTLIGKWGRFGYNEELETCSIIESNGTSAKKVLFAMGFCVPAIVIVVCYSLIFYVISRSEERMKQHRVQNKQIVNGVTDTQIMPEIKMDKEEKRKKNEWRLTKMILTIFIAFLVSYMPITIIKFVDPHAENKVLHLIGYIFIYLSCCINPLIYVIMNRQYRHAFKAVLLCLRPRLASFQSDEMKQNGRKPSKCALVNDKTIATQISDTEGTSLPECHELPEVFLKP